MVNVIATCTYLLLHMYVPTGKLAMRKNSMNPHYIHFPNFFLDSRGTYNSYISYRGMGGMGTAHPRQPEREISVIKKGDSIYIASRDL